MELQDYPITNIPTKFNKYRRIKEKQDVTSGGSTTCRAEAAVVNSTMLLNGDPDLLYCAAVMSNNTNSLKNFINVQSSTSCSSKTVPPWDNKSLFCNSQPSPPKKLLINRANEMSVDDVEMPLNLTTSSRMIKTHHSPSFTSHQRSNSPNSFSTVSTTAENMIIEEHFQKSRGTIYTSLITSNPSLSTNQSSSENVSIAGCVDDHFSKSLGEVWTKMKASSNPTDMDVTPTSVDDHFAKALGADWHRIKAEKQKPVSEPSNSPHFFIPRHNM